MSEVSLTIGGRTYKVACADGEEGHVARLGEAVDARLASMPQLSAQDAQNLLFGALLLADELHDLRNAQTAAGGEAEEARAEAERLQAEADTLAAQLGEAEEARAEAERLRAETDTLAAQLGEAEDAKQALETLQGELDELRQAEADMGAELQAAQSAEAELREQLAAVQAAPPTAAFDDPELVPALERFAELLESCADKLEGSASSA